MEMGNPRQVTWADMKEDENSESMESSSMTESEPSSSSSLSTDLADDASSSTSRSPLYEFADLMAQLPIKRGLSKFYDGRSESLGSLLSVRNVEDLAKKEISYSKRMKWCKNYGTNLNRHRHCPKATIAKKSPKVKGTLTFSPKAIMANIN